MNFLRLHYKTINNNAVEGGVGGKTDSNIVNYDLSPNNKLHDNNYSFGRLLRTNLIQWRSEFKIINQWRGNFAESPPTRRQCTP